MSDGLGGMAVEQEMATGDRHIGSDGQLFAGTRAEQGAVVADAESEFASAGGRGAAANAVNQVEFAGQFVYWARTF